MVASFLFLILISKSPQQIAFTIGHDDISNICVINLDGTGRKQITSGEVDDNDPVWSPDGTKIAFTRVIPSKAKAGRSNGHVWIVNPDGTGLKQLSSGGIFDGDIHWDRNSKGITVFRQGGSFISYRIDLNGHAKPAEARDQYTYAFAPKGDLIAYARPESDEEDDHHYDIWLTNNPAKPGRRLTHYKTEMYSPVWSPDGKGFVFVLERQSGKSIQWLSANGKSKKTLQSRSRTSYEDPAWSPDGKRVAYLESKNNKHPMTNESFRQLYVMDADGTHRKRLTNHWGDDYKPQWTRDGKSILVSGSRGTAYGSSEWTNLVSVDPNGKGEKRICNIGYGSGILSP